MRAKKKSWPRVISLALTLVLLLSCAPGAVSSNAVSAEELSKEDKLSMIAAGIMKPAEVSGELEPHTVPEAINYAEAVSKNHIERLYSDEGTDLNTVVFLNIDGTKTRYTFGYPVKYVDSDGCIKDISLQITDVDIGYQTAGNSVITTFSENITDGIILSDDETNIKLIPVLPAQTTDADVLGDVAYSDADYPTSTATRLDDRTIQYYYDPNTTIEYSLTYTGFKEDIVVSEYTGQTQYEFVLLTNGYCISRIDGSYYLVGGNQQIRASIGEIIIFTADERNNTFGDIMIETIVEGQEYRMTILLDAEYLSDPNTAYPIRIDPTIEVNYNNNGAGAIEDVTINSNAASNGYNNVLYVGTHEEDGISRILMKFPGLDLSGLGENVEIQSAAVSIRDLMCESDPLDVYCYVYTLANWTEATANGTDNAPGGIGTFLSATTISYEIGTTMPTSHRYTFDITKAVQGWHDGIYDQDKGIILKAHAIAESGTDYVRKTIGSYNRGSYAPTLTITYVEHGSGGGNTFDESVVLHEDTMVEVAVVVSGEKRYFKFIPGTTGFYTLESANNNGDPYVWLYNANREQLGYNDDGSNNRNFDMTYHLAGGRVYYFAVGCFSQTVGTYQVSLKKTTLSSKVNATTTVTDTSHVFVSTKSSEVKCYSFTPTETREYVFQSANSTGDPRVHIYDDNLRYVGFSDTYGSDKNFRLEKILTAGKTYYIVLYHTASDVGSYVFSILRPASVENMFYNIKNCGSGKYLDIHGPNDQIYVHQWTTSTGEQQKWLIQQHNDGYYTIRSQYDRNLFVGIVNANIGENNVHLFNTVSDQTRWNIYTTSEGGYIFEPKTAMGKALYAPDSGTGTEMQLVWMDMNSVFDNWLLLDYVYQGFTFSAFDVGNSAQDEAAIVYKWLTKFGYTNIGTYNNAEDAIDAQTIKDVGRYSDIVYINGHGEPYANMRIQNAEGKVVEYLCADLSCTSDHAYDVPRVVIGAQWLPGSTTKTNSYWNIKTKWGILAQCSQLNFGTVGEGEHWNGLSSAEMWARTMLGDGEQVHGYLGYNNSAPGGSAHTDRLEKFFSYLDAWYSMIEAWSAAHTRLIGSSNWAAIYHDEHADDFITDMTGVYNGSDHDIYYISRNTNDTGLDLRANTLPIEEMALQISNRSIPVFADNSTMSQSAKETYSRLQKSLLYDRPGIVNIEDNGMIVYCAEDRNWGKQGRSYVLSDFEAISVAESLLEEHGLLPNENYRASVSKIQRVKMDLSGEKKNEVPETIEYVVSFYRTYDGIDVLSDQEDGILVSFDTNGLTELRYLWRDVEYASNMQNMKTNFLTILQASKIYQTEIMTENQIVVDPNGINMDNVNISIAYLQINGAVRPVYVFSTDMNYTNSVFVDMYTGEMLCPG